ncbi:MAG: hypothetical protein JXB23_07275 [Candidatus Aminicenantes bacterium]|nr:hypothetical protein [Candidatus Aminicenantes bacterium]
MKTSYNVISRMKKNIIIGIIAFGMICGFSFGQTFDPESIIQDKEFKKELQRINSQPKAENIFLRMAKGVLTLKDRVDFCEELWDGAFTKQIEVIMDVPVEKWNMAGWGYNEIQNVKQIVSANRKNALVHQLKDKGAYLAMAVSLFSIANDIYKGIEGEDAMLLKAVLDSYSFMQGYVMNKLGIGISNIATMGANIIAFSLNLFISDVFDRYEDYWWTGYMQYMEKHYNFESWYELAQAQGEQGIKARLYEFWDDALLNAGTHNQGETRTISQASNAERLYKEKFAAYYYSQFVYKPFLKEKFEEAAALEAYEKEKLARQKYQDLMQLIRQIDLLRKAIADAEKLKEKEEEAKPVSLSITPAGVTLKIDETVSFRVLAKDEAGKYEDVTAASLANKSFTAKEPGTFRVTANYEGLTATATITVEKPEEKEEDVDQALDDMEGDEEEEDICSRGYLVDLIARLNDLVSQAGIRNAKFAIYTNKFEKEVNDQAADPCTNGIVAYSFYNALLIAAELETIIDGIQEVSTEIIMLLGICPDLSQQMQSEGFSVKSVVKSIAGLGGYESRLANMRSRLGEKGCDENEVQQSGERINPLDVDPDFAQDGGLMVEIPGDSVDNDADGLQDESPETLAANNIILVLFDSGSAKDDVFSVSVSGRGTLGVTPKGGRQSFGITLPEGNYTATIRVINAPDNVGTFTLSIYEKGVQIATLSGAPPEGGVAVLPFSVRSVN